jgi:hypothetical protein
LMFNVWSHPVDSLEHCDRLAQAELLYTQHVVLILRKGTIS